MLALVVWMAVGTADDWLAGPAVTVDGDTMFVSGVKVRLQGIDAPEWDQTCWNADQQPYACGHRVSQAVAGWLRGREVSCRPLDTDKYGRTIAQCFVGTEDVAQRIVRGGGALAYVRYSELYVPDEAWARARLLGLWSGPFDPPEAWRHLSDEEKAARVPAIEASLRSDPSGRSITPLR